MGAVSKRVEPVAWVGAELPGVSQEKSLHHVKWKRTPGLSHSLGQEQRKERNTGKGRKSRREGSEGGQVTGPRLQ